MRAPELWGAHACSVLVAAFCGDELFFNHNITCCRRLAADEVRDREDALANTRDACAPQTGLSAEWNQLDKRRRS